MTVEQPARPGTDGQGRLAGQEVLLAKPETFMNLSGLSVAALLKELELGTPAEDLIVLYDELAIPLGQLRIANAARPTGTTGSNRSWRRSARKSGFAFASGSANRPRLPGREIKAGGTDYLLAPMRRMQLQELDRALDRVTTAVETILQAWRQGAMNEFNRKPEAEAEQRA